MNNAPRNINNSQDQISGSETNQPDSSIMAVGPSSICTEVSGADARKPINKKFRNKWPWIVTGIVFLTVLIVVAVILIWKPWAKRAEISSEEKRGDASVNGNADSMDKPMSGSEETPSGTFAGETISVAEGMRRSCNELKGDTGASLRIVTGAVPTHWQEGVGYLSYTSDPEYLWICDWRIGIELEKGLDIAYQTDNLNQIWFAGITKDTQFYQQNRFDNNMEAPDFFSELLKDKMDLNAAMMTIVRVSEQEYNEKMKECNGDGECLDRIKNDYRAFLKHNGYLYIQTWSQTLRASCDVSQSSSKSGIILAALASSCPEMEWEQESRSRLAEWADGNWITF